MFDWLVETFSAYPYVGVGVVFFFCGLGLPLPEEIVLVAAGYVVFKDLASLDWMMVACTCAILLGDLLPFALGRVFGLPLLRLRPMRMIITTQRLARFNRWFRRRGHLVIFFARFVAGIRVVAYFTAGTLKTSWLKFILIDLLGIVLIVPLLVFVGYRFGQHIDDAIAKVQQLERGMLITGLVAAVVIGGWYYLRWRRRQRALVGASTETFVEPSQPVRKPSDEPDDAAGE